LESVRCNVHLDKPASLLSLSLSAQRSTMTRGEITVLMESMNIAGEREKGREDHKGTIGSLKCASALLRISVFVTPDLRRWAERFAGIDFPHDTP